MTTRFETVTEGLRFPEGPIAMPDGSIILVEIERGTLTRVEPGGHKEVIAHLGGGPNGAAIGPDGHCYVCNNGGFTWHSDGGILRPSVQALDYGGGRIERVNLKTGEFEVLYTHGPHGPLRGPNDIVFDAQGGFWFSDLGKVRPRDADRGGVYYATCDGTSIREVVYPMLFPNGVGLSPDERQLYVAETDSGRLWAFDLTAPGAVGAGLAWPSPHGGRLLIGLPGLQRLDSLAVEAAGNICVATLSEKPGISVVAPTGGLVEHIPFPDPGTTNICFGGANLSTAFVTQSTTGRLVAADWPRPGLGLNFLNTR